MRIRNVLSIILIAVIGIFGFLLLSFTNHVSHADCPIGGFTNGNCSSVGTGVHHLSYLEQLDTFMVTTGFSTLAMFASLLLAFSITQVSAYKFISPAFLMYPKRPITDNAISLWRKKLFSWFALHNKLDPEPLLAGVRRDT